MKLKKNIEDPLNRNHHSGSPSSHKYDGQRQEQGLGAGCRWNNLEASPLQIRKERRNVFLQLQRKVEAISPVYLLTLSSSYSPVWIRNKLASNAFLMQIAEKLLVL